MHIHIREALDFDREAVLSVEQLAFERDDEAELVQELLDDPSARPLVSLLAMVDDRAVGHILFTRAYLTHAENAVAVVILAPLAVVPDAQKQGVGGKLVERGLQLLAEAGVDLIFVLGHPAYYPRYGFTPAISLGLEPPYPLPDAHVDAWMVRALRPGVIGIVSGKVRCADALNRPEYWRE